MRADANGRLVRAQAMARLGERLRPTPRQAQTVNHVLPDRADRHIARRPSMPAPKLRSHPGRLFHDFGGNDRVPQDWRSRPPGVTRTAGTTGEDSIVFLDRRRSPCAA